MNAQEKKTILLVEDEVLIAMAGAETVKSFGYEVITAHTGKKAVELASNNENIGLILMDIDLGEGMDGPEAARQILEKLNIPIVFQTSHTEREYVERVKQIIRYGYVIKNSGDFVLQTSIEMAFELFNAHLKIKSELTERKRTEDAQRVSEKRFRRISAITSDIAYSCRADEDGRFSIDWMTGAADRITGYSIEEIKAQGCWRFLVIEEDVALFEKNIIGLSPGSQGSCELRILHKNGDVVFISAFAECISEGPLPGSLMLYGSLSDINGRKQAEFQREAAIEALSESEKRLREVLENSLDVSYKRNLQTNDYDYLSPVFVKISGYTMDEFKHMPMEVFMDFIHPDDIAEIERVIAESMFGAIGMAYQMEYRFKHKKGHYRWCYDQFTVIRDAGGQPLAIIGSVSDITERKQAEEHIQSLLAEKELILHEVHHRIKNNMSTIISLLSLQAKTIKEPSAIEALNDAENRVRSMMVLYDKLYRSTDLKVISIKEYLSSLADEIISNLPNSGAVKIEKRVDDFTIDAKKIQPLGIIINELLTNIMKYAFKDRADGLITVSASLKDNHVSLIVQDDGSGMPESIDFENSPGFGLMLVGILTKQLDGTIRIERENGTRVILEFDI